MGKHTKPVDTEILDEILNEACLILKEHPVMVKSKCRKKELVAIRKIVVFVSKNVTCNTLKTIGHYLGKRNHATVIYNYRNALEDIKKSDATFMKAWIPYQEHSSIWSKFLSE